MGKILPNQAAVVKQGVVTDHVNVPIATQGAPQMVQVSDEQLGVASGARRAEEQFARLPVEAARLGAA